MTWIEAPSLWQARENVSDAVFNVVHTHCGEGVWNAFAPSQKIGIIRVKGCNPMLFRVSFPKYQLFVYFEF